jgi:uroporphyrinogen-III synthase
MRILVVRPQPGADATAARLEALGHKAITHPLLITRAAAWSMPAAAPDAVILTSAAAVRHAGPNADALKLLPAHAVGAATATAARAAGWTDVHTGPGTVQALIATLTAGQYLHLAGAEVTPVNVPPTISLTRITVYETPLQPLPALPAMDAVLLHSPRTAAHFAAEWDRLGGQRHAVRLYAISAPSLAAAGSGWRQALAAPEPSEAALLAMLPKAL